MDTRIETMGPLRTGALAALRDNAESKHRNEVWQELICSVSQIVDTFYDETHAYLILRRVHGRRLLMTPIQLTILEQSLNGICQNNLAIDLRLSNATIATQAKKALSRLGLSCIPSRVPLPLVLLAQSIGNCREDSRSPAADLTYEGARYHVLQLRRPDVALARVLPPAEAQVLRARLEGQSHRSIAVRRRTSARTIANQLASAARRLGVSGRIEILYRLAVPPPTVEVVLEVP